MNEEVVGSIWKRRLGWSQAADRLKNRITYARTAALVMSSLGAVLATVAATLLANQPSWHTACAAIGAVLLALATFITAHFLTVDAVRAWTRARSVSEAIKGEVYTFRAGAAPYHGPDAIRVLQGKVKDVEKEAQDLERHVAEATVPASTPPPALAPEAYVENRVTQQIEGYYRKNARFYARRLELLKRLELVLGGLAVVLSGVAAFVTGLAPWVAVLTTLGAALAAHMAASRYDFLVMSYYATARRLKDLVDQWRAAGAPTDPTTWSAFVKACEDAISVENEGWLAKWAEQVPTGTTRS